MTVCRAALVLAVALAPIACKDVNPQNAVGALAAATPSPTATRTVKPGIVKPISPISPTSPTLPTSPKSPSVPSGKEEGKLAGSTTAHNNLRTPLGVSAVSWSNELGAWAQARANQLAANNCQLAHRPAGADAYGENLFWSSNASTATSVVARWAAEKSSYDHATNSCSGQTCGHYTQVVWAATTSIGCGMASCPNGGEVWVCNYSPQGNVQGQSPY